MSKVEKLEFLLVVVDSFGGKHYTEKRDREHANTGLKHAIRDRERSPFYRDGDAWIESRTVSGWEKI